MLPDKSANGDRNLKSDLSSMCSGVRPSPGAATLERELAIEPSTTLYNAELAVAEDGHTPLKKYAISNSQPSVPNSPALLSAVAPPNRLVSPDQVAEVIAKTCPPEAYRGRRVLVIVPDGTRTAPVGLLFQTLHRQIAVVTKAFDVMIALGTHQPMSEPAICERLEISLAQRKETFQRVRFLNHAWNDPGALRTIGVIPADEIKALTGGLFAMDVPVEINRRIFEYDQIIIIGPVFPHEVVGFSGGNKYLFPGVAGPQILNFFHWLGAVVTNPMIIGNKWTPVRKVVDRAGAMVQMD